VRARFLTVAIACVLPAAARADRNLVVLLPFDDLAGRPAVARSLAPFAAHHLARRGYDVVYGMPVENVLERLRVRYLDSLTADAMRAIREELGADGVVLGALLSYREGGHAAVAFSARLLGRDGEQAWTGVVGLSSDETTGMLGLGRVSTPDALIGEAASRLFSSFPDASRKPAAHALPRRRARAPHPATYRAPGFDPARFGRVCVLPFDNFATHRGASRILAELATRRLGERGGLRVVEAGELRQAMNGEEVRSFRNVDSGQLQRIGRRLGASLFLSGSVYAYRDPEAGDPEVDLQLTLVDVDGGRVLWTSRLARKGSDYMRLLQRGSITTAAALADQVLAEMVDGLFDG
jgi:TolB-like protein